MRFSAPCYTSIYVVLVSRAGRTTSGYAESCTFCRVDTTDRDTYQPRMSIRVALMSTKWRLFLSVLAIAAAVYTIVDKPINQGLDLKGGTQVVLDLTPRPGQTISNDLAERTLEVLRNRVDSLGVAEPNLEIANDRRIIVELPGVSDPEQAISVIGSTAQLTFHSVQASLGPIQNTPDSASTPTTTTPPATESTPTTAAGLGETSSPEVLGQSFEETTTSTTTTSTTAVPAAEPTTTTTTLPRNPDGSGVYVDDAGQALQLGPTVLTGEGVDTANAQPPDPNHTGWYIELKFKGDGEKAWTKVTGEAACASSGDPRRQVAIVLDNRVISHPEVSASGSSPVQCGVGITGSTTEITGQFSQKEAKTLALLVRGGALPVDVSVASQQVIGPELGKDAIDASVRAVLIGGALTILFILGYYRMMGVLAALALAIYGVLTFGVLVGINVTLTLPGIAGFVLGVAMAMDSNVLVYERVKEEFGSGRSLRSSASTGFKNALSAIIDSNATTFIAALTLYFVAVGEVRGFGVTLLIGTAVSIFVTLVVLRTLATGLLGMEWARKRPTLLGMSVGSKFRKRMTQNPPNLMKVSKYVLAIALFVTVAALAGVTVRGINYGIEFSGGRLLEYKTATAVDIDQARSKIIDDLGFDKAVVQRSGTDDTSIRVPELSSEQATQIEQVMKDLGGGTVNTLRDETVGPSFSDELKRKAMIGLSLGLLAQLIYVGYRFRWTFGLGAVVAMIHDALLVLGIFAWWQKPFDAVFLAALLTIIAFSVNDSVVVFDRIREQRRRRLGEPFARVVNDACAQIIPRTINISVSALFILVTLWWFGGQTLGDFALALTLGVITGVYSSIFIASPIAVALEKLKPSMSAGRGPSVRRSSSSSSPSSRATDTVSEHGQSQKETGASETTSAATSTLGTKSASSARVPPRPRKKKRR